MMKTRPCTVHFSEYNNNYFTICTRLDTMLQKFLLLPKKKTKNKKTLPPIMELHQKDPTKKLIIKFTFGHAKYEKVQTKTRPNHFF